jgi:hypothetical protein
LDEEIAVAKAKIFPHLEAIGPAHLKTASSLSHGLVIPRHNCCYKKPMKNMVSKADRHRVWCTNPMLKTQKRKTHLSGEQIGAQLDRGGGGGRRGRRQKVKQENDVIKNKVILEPV